MTFDLGRNGDFQLRKEWGRSTEEGVGLSS